MHTRLHRGFQQGPQVEPRPPAEMEAVRWAYVANGRTLRAVDNVLRIDALG